MMSIFSLASDQSILEFNIQPDHVHLLIQTRGDDSPSEVIQLIKGGTSRKLRELFPELEESIWSKGFWADGYYGGSVGKRDLEIVKAYVKNQTKHHSMKNNRDKKIWMLAIITIVFCFLVVININFFTELNVLEARNIRYNPHGGSDNFLSGWDRFQYLKNLAPMMKFSVIISTALGVFLFINVISMFKMKK